MKEKFYYRGVNEGALLHQWLNLMSSGLDGSRSCFKRKNWGLSVQMNIYKLTLANLAYWKYDNKLKLQLLMQCLCVNEMWGYTLWEQVNPHTIHFGTDTCYIDTDSIFRISHLISPRLCSWIVQGVFNNREKF